MTGHASNVGSAGNVGSTGNTGVAGSPGVAGIEAAFATAVVRRCAVPEPVVIGYRPTEAMIRTVKGRDGHCRFPGCTVAATFCDLDHVIAWREGSTLTRVSNLISLCRRHHRTKQLRRWSVRMLPGAVVQWTDPTGRQRLTHPVNHLNPDPQPWLDPTGRPITDAHLNHSTDSAVSTDNTGTKAPDGPSDPVELPSALEENFEYLIDRFYADTGTPAARLSFGPTPRPPRSPGCDFHTGNPQFIPRLRSHPCHTLDTRPGKQATAHDGRRPADDYPPPPF
jgi:hypothetical protein